MPKRKPIKVLSQDELSYKLKETKVTQETVNRGNPCFFKDEEHYILYESDTFTIISKNKDFKGAFSVPRREVSYVKSK